MSHPLDSTGEGSILRRLAEQNDKPLEDILLEAADPELWIENFLEDSGLVEAEDPAHPESPAALNESEGDGGGDDGLSEAAACECGSPLNEEGLCEKCGAKHEHVLGMIHRPQLTGQIIKPGLTGRIVKPVDEGDGYEYHTPDPYSLAQDFSDPMDDGIGYYDSGPGSPIYDENGRPIRGLQKESLSIQEAVANLREARRRKIAPPGGAPVTGQDVIAAAKKRDSRLGKPKSAKGKGAARKASATLGVSGRRMRARKAAKTRAKRARSGKYDRLGTMARSRRRSFRESEDLENLLETYRSVAAARLEYYPVEMIEALNKALESLHLNEGELDESQLWGWEDIESLGEGIEAVIEAMEEADLDPRVIEEEVEVVLGPLHDMLEALSDPDGEGPEAELEEAVNFALTTLVPL